MQPDKALQWRETRQCGKTDWGWTEQGKCPAEFDVKAENKPQEPAGQIKGETLFCVCVYLWERVGKIQWAEDKHVYGRR